MADVSDETMNMIIEAASKTDEGRDAIEGLNKSTEALQKEELKKNEKDVLADEELAKKNSKTPEDNIIQLSYKERLENHMRGRFEDVDQ